MLHHFIRLIGFSAPIEASPFDFIPYDDTKNVYYLPLDEDGYTFPNVINYAKKYFNCSRIDRIDLYNDEHFDDDHDFDIDYDYDFDDEE